MPQFDTGQFFQLYRKHRHMYQLGYYTKRQREFSGAYNEALALSITLIVITTLASAFESLSTLRLFFTLVAVVCPVLAAALTAYNALYSFEEQAKLYDDARSNLEVILAQVTTLPQEAEDEAEFHKRVTKYVQEVEGIFSSEEGQWGQLARSMKPPEI